VTGFSPHARWCRSLRDDDQISQPILKLLAIGELTFLEFPIIHVLHRLAFLNRHRR
jgi:hypothetical protein